MPLQTNKNCATGVLEDYSGGPLKYGRLLCDGSSYATALYPQLFALIGYTYGGSGANFNVPDIRGRATAGQDNNPGSGFANRLTAGGSGINGQTLGAAGGVETEILTSTQSGLPIHSVSVSGTTSGQSAIHTHTVGNSMGDTGADSPATRRFPSNISDGFTTTPGLDSSGPSNDHTHTWGGTTTVVAQNAAAQHQVTQPTFVVIKTIMYA
jgi:microcystin-dependent protein